MKNRQPLGRRCIVCGVKSLKNDMHRVVMSNEGKCVIDKAGTFPGRGAYICNDVNCWGAAQLNKRATIALRVHVGPSNDEELKLFANELRRFL